VRIKGSAACGVGGSVTRNVGIRDRRGAGDFQRRSLTTSLSGDTIGRVCLDDDNNNNSTVVSNIYLNYCSDEGCLGGLSVCCGGGGRPVTHII